MAEELELVEQCRVEGGETLDGCQSIRSSCTGKARMEGVEDSDLVGGGQQFPEAGSRVGSTATVQQQERLTLTPFIGRDIDKADAREIDGMCCRGHRVSQIHAFKSLSSRDRANCSSLSDNALTRRLFFFCWRTGQFAKVRTQDPFLAFISVTEFPFRFVTHKCLPSKAMPIGRSNP